MAVEPFGEEHVARHLAGDGGMQLLHLVLDEGVAGLPHHGHTARFRDRIRQRLRTLHVENDRLTATGPREHVTRVQEQQVVAPDDRAVRVHDADAIGITIECDTDVRALLLHGPDQVEQIFLDGRIGVVIRERAITLAEEIRGIDVHAREDHFSERATRTVACIEHDLEPTRQWPGALDDVIRICRVQILGAYRTGVRSCRRIEQFAQALNTAAMQ